MKKTKSRTKKLTLRETEQKELIISQGNQILRLETENQKLRASLQHRLDQSMLKERIQLVNSIGQLTEAVSKAIQFVIAKETL